jgi:hypothetical protein
MVPLLDLEANVTTFSPPNAAKCAIPGVAFMIFIMVSKTSRLRVLDEASGNSNVTNKRPSSSVGRNPVGLLLNNNPVAIKMQTRRTIT